MGEQRGFAPLLTVDLASVTVELNLCESGARFPCKWSSVLEIYKKYNREINALVDEVEGLSEMRKRFYKVMLQQRYEKILMCISPVIT